MRIVAHKVQFAPTASMAATATVCGDGPVGTPRLDSARASLPERPGEVRLGRKGRSMPLAIDECFELTAVI